MSSKSAYQLENTCDSGNINSLLHEPLVMWSLQGGSLLTIQVLGPLHTNRLKISGGEAQKCASFTSSPRGDSYIHRVGSTSGLSGKSFGRPLFIQSHWLIQLHLAARLYARLEAEATCSIRIISDVMVLPGVPHHSMMLNCDRQSPTASLTQQCQLGIQWKVRCHSWKGWLRWINWLCLLHLSLLSRLNQV